MLIKNQNVDIIKSNNFIKIINMQNSSTPGIKYKVNLKQSTDYTLIVNGYKSNKKYNVKFWIVNLRYIPILNETYYLSDIEEKHIIKFNTQENEDLYIGLLFDNCPMYDYFVVLYLIYY